MDKCTAHFSESKAEKQERVWFISALLTPFVILLCGLVIASRKSALSLPRWTLFSSVNNFQVSLFCILSDISENQVKGSRYATVA